ncbi:porin [Thalassobacter sp. 16PALIMAR09]|uniref:porin n=1 Tax=Thalassobacter sp. 16PALIMAR09 TaxID=1225651 RepID=UPI00051DD320|nr:porin [Thalassobacter sp. 16PALIMAR09]KGL00745.1 porin [Thalassobacter sp. 16PALIMAR09]
MKKVLFATTAIVAFAGAASADVAVSGSAELGIADNGTATENVGFFSSVDVRFSMTGESDNGLAFGATIDLDDALEAGGNAAAQGNLADAGQGIGDNSDNDSIDYTIFVSGAFGSLTFGDTDGAMDWALTEGGNVGNPGSINDAETSYAGYAGAYLDGNGDGMIARYDYAFGDYALAVSVEQGVLDEENGYAIGFKGNVAGVSFGIAHQEGTAGAVGGANADLTGVSLGYGFGDLKAGIMLATGENRLGQDDDLMQLGLGYTTGAVSLHANYAERETNNVQSDGFGVAAKYDLGGGAGVHVAYGSGSVGTAASVDRWSLGLAMSF